MINRVLINIAQMKYSCYLIIIWSTNNFKKPTLEFATLPLLFLPADNIFRVFQHQWMYGEILSKRSMRLILGYWGFKKFSVINLI